MNRVTTMPKKSRIPQTAEQVDPSQRQLFEEMGRAAGLSPEEMQKRWGQFIDRSSALSRPAPAIQAGHEKPEASPRRDTLKVTVSLKPDLASKLAILKERWGLKSNSEVLRRLLTRAKP